MPLSQIGGLRPSRRQSIMMARNSWRLLVLLSALGLTCMFFPQLYRTADYVRQTNPFSEQKFMEQAFQPSDTEKACLRGLPIPGEQETAHRTEPIPNTVHFTFGLSNPLLHPGAGRFGFLNYLSVRSAIVTLRPEQIYLHYTYMSEPPSLDASADPMTNSWVHRLAKDITLVHHPPAESNNQYAHLSDTLRLKLLLEHGGIYLDIDAFALRPFDELLASPRPHDVVLGAEGGNRWGLCNAIIAARANSSFVSRWLESYANADLSREWNYHSVLLPKELAQVHPEEVCTLAPDAFFWPTWTWRHVQWMHEPLDREEARHWEDEINSNGGSLFENQLAYHAWSQMAWDRHLKHLTPEVVGEKDTRFNLLVRRFVEDDL